jgi:DNA-binding PadR family transcriptional regulator
VAHVILGLLLIAPQSLYDLVKSFEAGVSLFYSASSGSIKRALDGLLGDGLIEVASADGARGRKVYRVSDAGRTAFRTWMTGEPTGDVETAALSRLYFLGLLPAKDRVEVLRRVHARIESGRAELERLSDRLAEVEIGDEHADLARYQLATLAYGLGSYAHAEAFFRELHRAEGG